MIASVERTMSDDQLIRLLKQGNNKSFGLLYQRYFHKVFQTCYSYSRNQDDAFDLAQDVLLKAFDKIHSFEGNSSFSTWLFSITRNHCISYLSKKNRVVYEDVNFAMDHLADDTHPDWLEERLNKEKMVGELGNLLCLLPEQDKQLLELKYHQNYSVKDLQEAFGLSASAVKMRLMRSRQRVEHAINRFHVPERSELKYA